MALKKRGGLGSGMSSLFSSNEIEEKHSGGVLEVDINKITPNPKPPLFFKAINLHSFR